MSSLCAGSDTAWEAGSDGSLTRRRAGIGVRLLIAQTMVLLAGAVTTWIVAAMVGPPLFRDHLHQAGVSAGSAEQFHAEEAYRYATVLSVGGAVAVSALTAFVVSWYISRRLQRSVTEVASAATAVAQGRYGIRVSPPHQGVGTGTTFTVALPLSPNRQSTPARAHQYPIDQLPTAR